MGFELDGILLYIYLYYSLSLRYTALLDAFAECGISESWTNQIIKSIYIYICISNKILEEIELVPVVYDYPTRQERFPVRTQAYVFFVFFLTRVYRILFYVLDDNDALQLLTQLLAHQELFAPTFSFVIQHILSRILHIKKMSFRMTVYF